MSYPCNYNPTFNIHMMIGLPACGKTYHSKELMKKSHSYNTKYLDFDANYGKTVTKILEEEYKYNFTSSKWYRHNKSKLLFDDYTKETIILDGLFPVENARIEILDEVISFILKYYKSYNGNSYPQINIHMHIWDEYRDACLNNDRFRNRDVDSKLTIKNLKIEDVNSSKIGDVLREKYVGKCTLKCKPHMHSTVAFNGYDLAFSECTVYDEDEFRSEEWIISGESRSWRGNVSKLDPEEPKDFVELDELLLKICPDLSFMRYKDLRNKLVTLEEDTRYDYYSTETISYWKINLKELYKYLVDNKIIEDDPTGTE